MKRRQLTVLVAGLLIGSPLLTEKPLAAEWDRAAGITLGAELSDNICLSDNEKQTQGFATATPDIRLRGRGARASVDLNGSVRFNSLSESDVTCSDGQRPLFANRQTWAPNVRYRGNLELIEDWLVLESDASARTVNIDPFAAGSANRIDGRDNVNIVYQYGAGALVQRRLFDSADMRVRYYYNEQINGVRQFGDSTENRGEFDLGTQRGNNRLTLGLSGRYSEIDYEGNVNAPAFDNTLSSAHVTASLRLSSSWQLIALAGEEWNAFTSILPDIDGSYWDASLRWSPNDRVELQIGTGERFFGTTPHASVRYRHKRSELYANYNRTVTTPRDLRATSGRFDNPFDDEFDPDFDTGEGVIPGLPPIVTGEPTFIGNTPVINERLNLRYRFSARRTTISVSASESRQKRLEDSDEATFSNLGLSMSRSLSSTLSTNMHLGWNQREGRGGNVGIFSQPSETWYGRFGFNRRLGNDTTISMNYQHTRRESDAEFNQYSENRLTLTVRHQF